MAKEIIKVNLAPLTVLSLLNEKLNVEKVDSSVFEVGAGKYTITAVYEKYFIRTSSKAGLVVIIDNMNEVFTTMKIVITGSAKELDLDWGAGNKLVKMVKEALKENII